MDLILDFNPYPMAMVFESNGFSGYTGYMIFRQSPEFRGFNPIDEQWISWIYCSWINEDFLLGIYIVHLLAFDVGVFEHQKWKNDCHLFSVNIYICVCV